VAGAGNVILAAGLRAIAKAVESPPAPSGARASSRPYRDLDDGVVDIVERNGAAIDAIRGNDGDRAMNFLIGIFMTLDAGGNQFSRGVE
jgi:hypothetical protein